MKKHPYILFILPVLFVVTGFGQLPANKITREEYIGIYKEIAIEEMNTFRIPASITLAQGILESANGNSTLAKMANNHFGIKCHSGWTGKTYHMDDDAKDECFRKYSDPFESFKDHSLFLTTRTRYAFLFTLEITDYKGWAHGLKSAGYATNPNYAHLLIKIIEDFSLHQYDKPNFKNIANNKGRKTYGNDADFKAITIGAGNRQIFENNGKKFIYARNGDSFYEIAQDFNIYTWQVYKYNDLKKNDNLAEGQIVFLEKKKTKSTHEYHTVSPGESLYDISQMYGVRLKKLCKYNTLDKNAKLFPDQKIRLR
jgi:LysM repeat protein